MKAQPLTKFVSLTIAFLACGLAQALEAGDGKDYKSAPLQPAVDWREYTISPVSNPIFFEDPRIRTEARVIFLYNHVGDDFGLRLPGGDLNLGGADIYAFGAQLRYAVTPASRSSRRITLEFGSVRIDPFQGRHSLMRKGIPGSTWA